MSDDKFDVSEPWRSSNQDWWDWYVDLACNDESLEKRYHYELPDVLKNQFREKGSIDGVHSAYPLTEDDVKNFRKDGFIKLKDVFSGVMIAVLRLQIQKELTAYFGELQKSTHKFLSLDLLVINNS